MPPLEFTDEIRQFLAGRHIARVATIDPAGYPHSVPIWYILDADNLVMATGPNSQKVRNILANPRGAVAIGGEAEDASYVTYQAAYLFQGIFRVEPDPTGFEWIRRIGRRYRDDDDALESEIQGWGPHMVIRLHVERIVKVM